MSIDYVKLNNTHGGEKLFARRNTERYAYMISEATAHPIRFSVWPQNREALSSQLYDGSTFADNTDLRIRIRVVAGVEDWSLEHPSPIFERTETSSFGPPLQRNSSCTYVFCPHQKNGTFQWKPAKNTVP